MEKYSVSFKRFCPLAWNDWDALININKKAPYFSNLTKLEPDTYTVHLWNEMWRENSINKNDTFLDNCIYEHLKMIYL